MEMFTLNPTTFFPDKDVNDIDSAVWTERFFGDGELELTTTALSDNYDLLKSDTYLGIVGSREVIQVKSSVVEEDDDGVETLRVTGRSVSSEMMDGRIVYGGSADIDKSWKISTARTAGDWALWLFRYFLITGGGGGVADREIPGATTTKSFTATDTPQFGIFEKDFLSTHVLTNLNRGVVGLRTNRPLSPGSGINFEFYSGVDRTKDVVFDYHNGDLRSPQLLRTSADIKNVAIVFGQSGLLIAKPDSVDATGTKRREIMVDGMDIDPLATNPNYPTEMLHRGLTELMKYNLEESKLYSGSVSESSDFVYGENYKLGDLVTLISRYEDPKPMMVTEYIRSYENGIDSGYPTLSPPLKPWTPRPIKKYNPGGGTAKWK